MARLVSTALMMTLRPGSVSTMSDAPRAASRRVRHRDPDVRLLQRRRVVHAVTCHPADVLPLQQPYPRELGKKGAAAK